MLPPLPPVPNVKAHHSTLPTTYTDTSIAVPLTLLTIRSHRDLPSQVHMCICAQGNAAVLSHYLQNITSEYYFHFSFSFYFCILFPLGPLNGSMYHLLGEAFHKRNTLIGYVLTSLPEYSISINPFPTMELEGNN